MSFRKTSFFGASPITAIAVSLGILIACIALTGWIFNLHRLYHFATQWPSIKANTSIGIIFSGISLLLFIGKRRGIAFILSIIVFLLGIVTLSEYLFHFNARIDELFFSDKGTPINRHPGRMALFTAIAFIITAISLFAYSFNKKWLRKISEYSAILLFIFPATGLIGSLYNAGQLFRAANLASFSVPIAITGLCMAVAILFSKPDLGFLAVFQKQTAAAKTGIKGVFIIITILVLFGWLCLKGEEAGVFDKEMGLVIMIITFTVSFLFVTRTGIQLLNRSEDQLIASEKNLHHVLSSSADDFYVIDKSYRIILINELACKNLSIAWGKPVQLGDIILDLIPVEKMELVQESFKKVFDGERVEYELHHVSLDLPQWIKVNYMPVKDDDETITGAYVVSKDITEQKNDEAIIRESEAKYRSFFENSMDGILLTVPDGRVLAANPAARSIFRMTEEEICSAGREGLVDHSDFEMQFQIEERRRIGKIKGELTMLRKDGTKFPAEVSSSVFKDAHGQERTSMIIRDITERIEFEKELKEAESKFRNLVEKSLVGVYIIQDGKYAYVNPRFAELFGYTQEELINSVPVETIVYPDHRNIVKEKTLMRLNGEIDSIHYEVKGLKKDGEIIQLEVFGSRTQYVGKRAIIGTLLDISSRKKSEEDLRASESKYKLLFEKNPLSMWMVSMPEKDFIDVNDAAIAEYGYSKEEFLKMNARDIRPAGDLESYTIHNSTMTNIATNTLGIWRHLKKDGSIINVDIVTHDIINQGRLVQLVLANNVTEKYKAEEELKHSYEQIRRLSEHLQNIREEERTHIAREIHDELGQQLSVLKMDVSWLNKKLESTLDNNIKTKLNDLLELLDGTVNTVRRISSELRPSLLDDMGLVAAMEWHLKEFEKRSAIRTRFEIPQTEILLPDTVKTGLFRIFQESLTNAARHADAKKIDVSFQQKNGDLILKIKDDGRGFNKEKVALKKTLGILGMEERSLMMGGKYIISSTPGKGTLVTVSVPYEN